MERVPTASVHKMLPDEQFTVLPTLLTVYCTALYALRDRAYLRAGESVLIHAGAGALGIVAITMAQRMGAAVYTAVGSQAKRDCLIKEMGLPAEHIFKLTRRVVCGGHQGGDRKWRKRHCQFPRGRLDACELGLHGSLWPLRRDRLMADVLDLYHAGEIKPPPIAIFDAADIGQAYLYFNNKDRVRKVVISMENPQSRVPVSPAPYKAVFDPGGSYLLVACLGSLGRSLSRWMMARGARRFIFLGRSGCDKPTARRLVSRLRVRPLATGKPAISVGLAMISEVGYLSQLPLMGQGCAPKRYGYVRIRGRCTFDAGCHLAPHEETVQQPHPGADRSDRRPQAFPSFGVDSMLAAEFRTWFWNTFKVDVSFLDVVSTQKALYNLAEHVEEKLVASWQG
ncbi:hypothetical protein DL767_000967 [Monosporascus sp. MG133]|nr:hypothetical protein DL767_000967 [Monosporascus sp. MG133]